jgi:hypothetical protein
MSTIAMAMLLAQIKSAFFIAGREPARSGQ